MRSYGFTHYVGTSVAFFSDESESLLNDIQISPNENECIQNAVENFEFLKFALSIFGKTKSISASLIGGSSGTTNVAQEDLVESL